MTQYSTTPIQAPNLRLVGLALKLLGCHELTRLLPTLLEDLLR